MWEHLEMTDLVLYRDRIGTLANNKMPDIIFNDNFGNASILIEQLMFNAHSRIRIFSGRLHEKIYCKDNIIAATEHLLEYNKEATIQVLLQEVVPNGDETEEYISEYELLDRPIIKVLGKYPERSHIRRVSEKDKNLSSHFVVMDETGFRFCKDASKPSAIASFNQPEIASNLASQFDKLFNRGVEIPLK